jgi:glycosyltransferase involved in cell wall biosynthesis
MNKPIKKDQNRILHITPKLNPGGIESWLKTLSTNKKFSDRNVILSIGGEGLFDSEFEKNGVKIYHLKKHKNLLKLIKLLISIQKNDSVKILHLHVYSFNAIYAFVGRILGFKIVSHSHNKGINNQMKSINYGVHRYYKMIINWCSNYKLACSLEAYNGMFGEFEVHPGLKNVLPYAVDDTRFLPKRIEKFENKLKIGHVARFVPKKNHQFIIKLAMSIQKTELKDRVQFILVGDGMLREKIIQECENFGIAHLFEFRQPTIGVEEYFNNIFDCFILPSIEEGLGIVLLEAQLAGMKYIIASEHVPEESNITGVIRVLPLNKRIWLNEIQSIYDEIEINPLIRSDSIHNRVKKSEYAINENIKELNKIYTYVLR